MGAIFSPSKRIEAPCLEIKSSYDSCHTNWYRNEFLKGKSVNLPSECATYWDRYIRCVKKQVSLKYKVEFDDDDDDDDDDNDGVNGVNGVKIDDKNV